MIDGLKCNFCRRSDAAARSALSAISHEIAPSCDDTYDSFRPAERGTYESRVGVVCAISRTPWSVVCTTVIINCLCKNLLWTTMRPAVAKRRRRIAYASPRPPSNYAFLLGASNRRCHRKQQFAAVSSLPKKSNGSR
eukprot:scaffold267788_cov31-Prasinocladus_malaysianus.AAC.3